MERARISIIIPAKNAEKTISQTLRSIFSQSYGNMEVIVVDDGSEDRTIEKTERFGKVKILHRTVSEGADRARHAGLQSCSGDYIWFVDADDTIVPHSLHQLINQAIKYDSDILNFGTYWNFPFIPKKIRFNDLSEFAIKSPFLNKQILNEIYPLLLKKQTIIPNMWDKLYSRRVIEKSAPIPSGLIMGEDWIFNLQVFPFAQKMIFSGTYGYCWRYTGANRKYLVEKWGSINQQYNIIDNYLENLQLAPEKIPVYRSYLATSRINDLKTAVAERIMLRTSEKDLRHFIATEFSRPDFMQQMAYITHPDELQQAVITRDCEKILFFSRKHARDHRLFYNFMRTMHILSRFRNNLT